MLPWCNCVSELFRYLGYLGLITFRFALFFQTDTANGHQSHTATTAAATARLLAIDYATSGADRTVLLDAHAALPIPPFILQTHDASHLTLYQRSDICEDGMKELDNTEVKYDGDLVWTCVVVFCIKFMNIRCLRFVLFLLL